ncbi:hypothetical protein D6869_10675 [Lactococcus cremoris]|nr:hypothetical protein LLNZ_10970 [Lactococcus cremoris subsp. cremoris NZ9000]MCT4435199.1 hypothetical protein [Lactococcus cremoris]MCT4447366.1 hypothetical protein [Lactococcus cremoris]QTA77311.1 hypothetical protein D6869_10675 [Lactococcus cremoris]
MTNLPVLLKPHLKRLMVGTKFLIKKQERTFGGIIHSFQVGLYLIIQRLKIQKLTLLKKRYQLHLNYMLLVKIKKNLMRKSFKL